MTNSNNPDDITVLLPVTRYLQIFCRSWLPGVLSALFLLTALIMLRIDTQQARNHTASLEIIGRIHTSIQHMAIISREALRGNEQAFIQLHNNLDQLNHYSTLLQYGGEYQRESIPAVAELLSADLFKSFQNALRTRENQVRQILESREVLINLAEILKRIDLVNASLQRRLQDFSAELAQTSHASSQAVAVETVKILVQFITSSVSSEIQGGFQIISAADQLPGDSGQITGMIQTLIKGRDWLYSTVLGNQLPSETLSEIRIQFNALEDLLHTVQRLTSEATGAWHAMHETFSASDRLSILVDHIEQATIARNDNNDSLITVLFYLAVILALLSALVFIHLFSTSLHKRIQQDEQNVETTQKAILHLLDEMEIPASGDLTARMSVTENITGTIADSINLMIEALQNLVKKVNHAGFQVIDASRQAEQISSGLLDAAQLQTHKIEDVTVAVLGIAESLEAVSSSAQECADVARQTLHATENSANAVQDAMASMNEIRIYIQGMSKHINRLGERSQEIGEIVTLISDIAEQTNILALNASIQTTTAGEAGKGFAVIAWEIQRLAEHSTEATRQISTLVHNIRGDAQDTIIAMECSITSVVESTKRANTTGSALEEIETISKHLAQLVFRITEATHKQTRVSNKVARDMEDILSITRQTTQNTRQNADSIRQIAEHVTDLKVSTANFKV
ncbi:methyl-accepting chemotaxis protein [Nitrosomonas sp. HPC101]|uniref:methyl-accepting chemotaxis protein n=1 Tax=Nitrosomonas sp. HPC101 TaxID=1658667 RepID=UPI00136C9DE7|nr:methyl-accepting chemotaxis protein [Nitrosomonas sp. HPC101]MXS86481.1 methyl-accepting chemotaxis protein [Nitrosomonas sp. HPC101]